MECWGEKQGRLLGMLVLTFGFFVVEVVVSRLTASLAMLSDSFRMLYDVIALLVALVPVRFTDRTRSTSKNTYGWIRVEVIGALVNAVFLAALCFTIFLEAIERFTEPHQIEKPRVVIWVGVMGLVVNLLGFFLFHERGGRGHSHRGGDSSQSSHRSYKKSEKSLGNEGEEEAYNLMVKSDGESQVGQAVQIESDINLSDYVDVQLNGTIPLELEDNSESAFQLNIQGVFLHVLGDALGSVIVVVTALIFTYVWKPCNAEEICFNPCFKSRCSDHPFSALPKMSNNNTRAVSEAGPCWVLYLDPTLCLIMVAILLCTTFPLLKESALILLQTVPKQVDMNRLDEKLRSVEGVLAVHELHIWQLTGSRIIATVHVKVSNPTSYMEIAKRIKSLFHDEGIHATTVQPEFPSNTSQSSISECDLPCNKKCALKLCCDSSWKSGTESEALAYTEECSSQTVSQQQSVSLHIQQEPEVVPQAQMESTV